MIFSRNQSALYLSLNSKLKISLLTPLFVCNFLSHAQTVKNNSVKKTSLPVFKDVPFTQDYSIKYNITEPGTELYKVYSDRNGVIKILSSKGLMQPYSGEMLYPGTIVQDQTYRPTTAKKIAGIGLYKDQFVFVDDKAVLSNAWAGKLYSQHSLPDASIFAGGEDCFVN